MSGADDAEDVFDKQEDLVNQRILAQNKERKIKIIRILTVIAYLISVSAVAGTLSAYYVFIWNPHAGNKTDLPNAEGIVMALRRARSEYGFANAAHHEYADKRKFLPNMLDSHKSDDDANTRESTIRFQTTTVKSTTPQEQTMIGNVSESFTRTNKNS